MIYFVLQTENSNKTSQFELNCNWQLSKLIAWCNVCQIYALSPEYTPPGKSMLHTVECNISIKSNTYHLQFFGFILL